MKTKLIIIGIGFFLLSGCGAYMNKNVNPYYFGMTTIDPQIYEKSKDIMSYQYEESSVKYFLKRGYVIKAKSAFREQYVHPSWAELAAKQMGANVMLLQKDYVGTVSGRRTLAWTVPGDTYRVTSNTKGNINYDSNTDAYVYGSNGYGYGNSTTTGNVNYSSSTTTTIQGPDKYRVASVPYQNHYYDQYAVFLVKKYYWTDTDVPYYSDKKLENLGGYIKAGEWFQLSEKKSKYRRLIYDGKFAYVSRNDKVLIY
jgi:hypothetical protein